MAVNLNLSAVKACEELRVQSQSHTVKPAEAKHAGYLKVCFDWAARVAG